jgi:outer membrane protein TolC
MKETVIDYEASRTSSDTAQKQLIRDVEKEFYYLLTLQSELAILEKNRELAEKRYQQAESNYENGFATDLEVLQARVTASSYKPELSQARSDLDTETRNFLILLGMDPGSGIRLTGDLTQPPFQPDLTKLLEQSPVNRQDIREQLIEIESLKNDLNITRTSGYSPSLTVSGSWSTNVDNPLDRGSWESESWSDSGKIGFNLSVPLDSYIKGSGDSTDVSQDLIEIKKGEITLALLIDRAWVEIMNLHQQISTAQEILEQASQNRDLAEKSYELTDESYRLGGVERLDVEDAQQSALSAGQDYLRSQYQYLSGLIDLKYALNLRSMDELFELNGRSKK